MVPSAIRRLHLFGAQAGEQAALLVQQARGVGEQHQLLRLQHLRQLARHQVGVDVVGEAVLAHADGGDHRDEIAAVEHGHHRGSMLCTSPHMADVDDLRHLQFGGLAGDGHLAGADQVAVLAGEAHRLAAVAVDEVDDLLVDQAAQHHLHHVHGLGVGDAHPLHELALLADALQQVADLRAAAVHHHRVDAHQLHQHDVAGEAALEVFVHHGVAAVLHHHGLAAEALDVGEGLAQYMGDVGRGSGVRLMDGAGFRVDWKMGLGWARPLVAASVTAKAR
jgi:hypothetical protein